MINFQYKYVLFLRRSKPVAGVSMPVIGCIAADTPTLAKQQFARQRAIEEKFLFVQSWHDATVVERQEAAELQAKWEQEQEADRDVVVLEEKADGVYEPPAGTVLRSGLTLIVPERETIFPAAHISGTIQRESAQRKELLDLYDRAVKKLGEEGLLDQ